MINLKKIPPIDELLGLKEVNLLIDTYNRDFVVGILRHSVDEVRKQLRKVNNELSREEIQKIILTQIGESITRVTSGTLRKVINGTGVVLHTNLGRAPVSPGALNYLSEMAVNYNNLELDLVAGQRGSRYVHIEEILCRLTGAEGALVVNNNAAAVLLGLMTMARGKEVIVSRGQLIEIGGAFRIPEVMKLSGATLKEVGTTNKTYLSDYAEAINEETALLFSAHTSNYKIVGFTQEVDLEQLVSLGRQVGLPVMQDLGSGILFDLSAAGLAAEPTVQDSVKAGADVITFSGDKLLGGPQAGIIVGKKEPIEAMKKNQLTRALRVDKFIIAALEATLLEYLCGNPQENIPVVQMLMQPPQELYDKARLLCNNLQAGPGKSGQLTARVVEVEDMVGGGAYPTYTISGYGVEIALAGMVLDQVARRLRLMQPALLTRLQDDKILISVRTLLHNDQDLIVDLMQSILRVPGAERSDL
ncbi:L-seryl-tRNA(Sec) selenium transferase [Syntrophomonas erecta subsp. sporosyntropha]